MIVQLIQDYDPEIIPQIVKLEQETFGHGGMNEWHLLPLIRHGRVFVSLQDKKVIGSVQYLLDWENPKRAYLYGVAMAKPWRGMGVGTTFLQETFRRLSDEGIEEIELTVSSENIGAIKVYQEKLGFSATAFRKNEYGLGEDRMVMQVLLITNQLVEEIGHD